MTLPASGAISLYNVNVELGKSGGTAISMGDTAVRALAADTSGAISMSSFYGKTNWVSHTGTYASYTLHSERNIGTLYSGTFTGVVPKTIVVSGRLYAYDWSQTVSYAEYLNYETSGWVLVASGSKALSKNTGWDYSATVSLTRQERATQWKIVVVHRTNGNDHSMKMTSWQTG